MKLSGNAVLFLLFAAQLNAAEALPRKSAVLLLSGETQTAEGRAAVEKLKAEMAAQGVSVTEVSDDEAPDIGQAAALGGGGPVMVVENRGGKPELRVYDGSSGADITKDFNPAAISAMEMPQAAEAPKPEPAKKEKPIKVVSPANANFPYKKNHVGLAIGPAILADKNTDSLDMLADTNPGGRAVSDGKRGRFQLFYERTLSPGYSLGIMGGREIGGSAGYENGGKSISIKPKAITATLYLTRKFGRNFGFYAGGGPDFYSLSVNDPVEFNGLFVTHTPFTGKAKGAHAEAGFLLAIKNFSFRLGIKQIFFGDPGDMTSDFGGGGGFAPGKYTLIVKDGQTLDFRAAGQPLAANEKLFKPDFGGKAATLTLAYSFANW